MKKLMAILAAAVMSFTMFAGCGNSDSSTSTSANEPATSDGSTADESVPADESATDDSAEEFDSSPDYSGPKPAGLYESSHTELEEIRDISAWELVKEIKTGWNLGNTLDATGSNTIASEISWQPDPTKKEMIDLLKEDGFDLIRIPVSWGMHMDKNYNVDPKWMARVHEIVDYAIDNDMYVILNTHHEEWYFPDEENKEQDIEQLKALWTQIAEEFKNYDEHLIFEGLNEPRLRGTQYEWNGGNKASRAVVQEYAQAFYETVRASGGNNPKRMLMLTGYAASSQRNCLKEVWLPENDDKVIVSVHGYLPYSFALDTKGTDTFDDGNKGEIDSFFQTLADLFYVNQIPVIVGEYGCLDKGNTQERVECTTYYLETAKKLGIPCVWWDNNAVGTSGENFGMMDRANCTWKFPEIIDAIKAVYAD